MAKLGLLISAALAGCASAVGVVGKTAQDGAYYVNTDTFQVNGLTNGDLCSGSTKIPSILSAGSDVSSKVGGSTNVVASNACYFSFANLPDGTYQFGSDGIKVVVDRAAPVGTDMTVTETIFLDSTATDVRIPTTMFKDAIDGYDLTVSQTAATGGSMTLGFTDKAADQMQSSAYLTSSSTAATGAGNDVYTITATDKAGNTGTAMLTVIVRDTSEKPVPVFEVSDARGAKNAARRTPLDATAPNFYTGSTASKTSGSLDLTVTVSFPDLMYLTCSTASSALTLTTITGTVAYASACTGTTSAASRVFKFTVTGVSTANGSIRVAAGKFLRKSDNAPNAVTGVITVKASPTTLAAATASSANQAEFEAAVNKPYYVYIPNTIFTANNGPVEIIKFTTPQAGTGLSVQNGPIGLAAVSGTVVSSPVATELSSVGCFGTAASGANPAVPVAQVKFVVTGRDAAGFEADAIYCVKVNSYAEANKLTYTFATSSLAAEEGTAIALDSGADVTKTGTVSVTDVLAYLETVQDTTVSGTIEETITSTNNDADAGDYAFTSYLSAAKPRNFLYKLPSAISTAYTAAADVKTYLTDLKYENLHEKAVSSSAVNRRTARVILLDNGVVVGVLARPVGYTVTNDAPVVTLTNAIAYAEVADAAGKVLFSGLTITDDDDANLRSATVSIATTAGANYIACDTARDSLTVDPSIVNVRWSYSTSNCVLTISPLTPWGTIAVADMEAALGAVSFVSKDPKNPNGYDFRAAAKGRGLTVKVTDDASRNNAATPQTTTETAVLTITSVNTNPVWQWPAVYGPSGLFTSTDAYANAKTLTAADTKSYTYFKPTVVVPATGSLTGAKLKFDFNKVVDTLYAKGAIKFLDALDTTVAGYASVTLGSWTKAGSAWAGGAAITALGVDSSSSPALWTIDLPSLAAADVGEYKVTLTYAGATADLYFDVRSKACKFGTFTAATQYPDTDACTASLASTTAVAVAVGGSKTFGNAYVASNPANPATILAAYLSSGNAATLKTARDANRGATKVNVPTDAFSNPSGSLDLGARPISSTEANNVPAPTIGTVDAGVAVKLSPAGSTFNKPVTVCINVGTIDSGLSVDLSVSSQIDPNDVSKGYSAWESLADQVYNSFTGEVCGSTKHFSVVAPILVPVASSSTAQKMFAVGASCPNDCSGHGYCREKGQCLCFEGFSGYDCSARTCPSAESWDVPADSSAVHMPAECSARGTCDTKTGQCACMPGFEGSACERTACPNQCSGRGRCLLASELTNVPSSWNSWEADRIQVCKCDGGYTGEDCSQRVCPFGDDPETVCTNTKRQIQTIRLDFGNIPAVGGASSFSDPDSLYESDELSLAFTTKGDNSVFYTPSVSNIWDGDQDAADSLMKALTSLPQFAVSDVKVSPTLGTDSVFVEYDVEFTGSSLVYLNFPGWDLPSRSAAAAAGNTVSGEQNWLVCPLIDGTNFVSGCHEDGCRPLQKQPRLLFVDGTGKDYVSFNSKSVLTQPTSFGGNDFSTSGWAVSATITLNGDGTLTGGTYSVDFTVYGVADSASAIATTPLPPVDLRSNVYIGYGLHVDFDKLNAVPSGNSLSVTFNWRVPKCTVSEKQAADVQLESSECSNRGICDRKSGQCQCIKGYAGYNCGQQTVLL